MYTNGIQVNYNKKKAWDLTLYHSGKTSLAVVMQVMVTTGSHFTDAFRFNQELGRNIYIFIRVHIPIGKEQYFRELLGKRGELKELPKAKLNLN
jgi:hypothetical protein